MPVRIHPVDQARRIAASILVASGFTAGHSNEWRVEGRFVSGAAIASQGDFVIASAVGGILEGTSMDASGKILLVADDLLTVPGDESAPLPELVISTSGDRIRIAWPASSQKNLEQSPDPAGAWTPIGKTPERQGESKVLIVVPEETSRFYRLSDR